MIELTKINGQHFSLNAEVIESIEETPDTVITLGNGKTLMVREKMKVVVDRVLEYKKCIHSPEKWLKMVTSGA